MSVVAPQISRQTTCVIRIKKLAPGSWRLDSVAVKETGGKHSKPWQPDLRNRGALPFSAALAFLSYRDPNRTGMRLWLTSAGGMAFLKEVGKQKQSSLKKHWCNDPKCPLASFFPIVAGVRSKVGQVICWDGEKLQGAGASMFPRLEFDIRNDRDERITLGAFMDDYFAYWETVAQSSNSTIAAPSEERMVSASGTMVSQIEVQRGNANYSLPLKPATTPRMPIAVPASPMGPVTLNCADWHDVSDRWLSELAAQPDAASIQWLSVDGTQVTDAGVGYLNALKSLWFLAMCRTQVGNGGISRLDSKSLARLTDLHLSKTCIDDRGLEHLLRHRSLLRLGLSYNRVGDDGMELVSRIPTLRKLWLDHLPTNIDDTGRVRHPLTDKGIRLLAKKLRSIESLAFTNAGMTDGAVESIASLPKLQELYLQGTYITDDGIRGVLEMKRLRCLSLSFTRITDNALEPLSKHPRLQTLHLIGTKVSDAGLLKLRRLKSLCELHIMDTATSAEGEAKLQKALPELRINP